MTKMTSGGRIYNVLIILVAIKQNVDVTDFFSEWKLKKYKKSCHIVIRLLFLSSCLRSIVCKTASFSAHYRFFSWVGEVAAGSISVEDNFKTGGLHVSDFGGIQTNTLAISGGGNHKTNWRSGPFTL